MNLRTSKDSLLKVLNDNEIHGYEINLIVPSIRKTLHIDDEIHNQMKFLINDN